MPQNFFITVLCKAFRRQTDGKSLCSTNSLTANAEKLRHQNAKDKKIRSKGIANPPPLCMPASNQNMNNPQTQELLARK